MLLNRRAMMTALPAMVPAAAAMQTEGARKTNFYVLEQYFLENGSQPERIHNFFSKALIPTMRRFHKGPAIFAEALTAPHMPQVLAVFGASSVQEIFDLSNKLFADKDFSKAYDDWEAGEQPFLSASASLLQATDYSPEITVPERAPESRRILELRTYHSPTWRQLKALNERFSGPEIKIFHRVGVHPLFYSTTVFGTMRPNLTYLIPFASLAEREKAWNAFGADPEWIKVRRESIERGGQISSQMQISLYRAMAYSPIG
jgi:hypothetical protein